MNRQERRQRARQQAREGRPVTPVTPGPAGAASGGPRPAQGRPTLDAAILHHRAGRLAEAEAAYRAILAHEPGEAQALHLLGVVALQTGRAALARQLIQQAIASNPNVAAFHGNLGNVLLAMGERAGAQASYRTAVQLDPAFTDGHLNLGLVLEQQGDLAGACASYQRAVALQPTAEGLQQLGRLLLLLGRVEDAVEAYRQRLVLAPRAADAHHELGVALYIAGELDAAIASFEAALAYAPDYFPAHRELGKIGLKHHQPSRAAHHFQRAAALAPGDARVQAGLGIALRNLGDVAGGVRGLRRAVELSPADAGLCSELLLTLHMDPAATPDTLFADAVAWGRRHAAPLASQIRPHRNRPDPDRRLRIGYVAAGFYRHPIGYFLAPVLAAHDPGQVEVFVYSNDTQSDDLTTRLRGMAHHWREIARLGDAATADLVRADEIDVLIDLVGHTPGHRLLVFARKPAPVQASWLGYFDTTGIEAMDYLIADGRVCPDDDGARYVERVTRLPDCYVCYTPHEAVPDVGQPPLLQRGAPTFGCFNNLGKITPAVIQVWAGLLRRVPDSRLLLKAPSLSDAQVRAMLAERFATHGISPERLELRGATAQAEHLASYADVDVALDPFPYNGGTTTAEALWMGVPVVTLAGDRWVSRVGTSILSSVGLDALVATTPAAYVDLAASLAADTARLRELRATLRGQLARSALCDADRFTRALESAYREMWHRWCAATGR